MVGPGRRPAAARSWRRLVGRTRSLSCRAPPREENTPVPVAVGTAWRKPRASTYMPFPACVALHPVYRRHRQALACHTRLRWHAPLTCSPRIVRLLFRALRSVGTQLESSALQARFRCANELFRLNMRPSAVTHSAPMQLNDTSSTCGAASREMICCGSAVGCRDAPPASNSLPGQRGGAQPLPHPRCSMTSQAH